MREVSDEMSKVVLAIDPSTIRVGWATLELPLQSDCPHMLSAGWKYGSLLLRGDSLVDKMKSMEPLFEKIGVVSHLVVEQPTFFNSEAGRIAAREGHIIRLAIMLGYIMGNLALWGPDVTMYTPVQWKGSVPKGVTRLKLLRTFRDAQSIDEWGRARKYDHDTVDAIMLLHYWLTQKCYFKTKKVDV